MTKRLNIHCQAMYNAIKCSGNKKKMSTTKADNKNKDEKLVRLLANSYIFKLTPLITTLEQSFTGESKLRNISSFKITL